MPRIDPKKYPVSPEALLGAKQEPAQRRPQTPLEIDAVMRQWRAVQAA